MKTCSCGHPLKKPNHSSCYKCHLLKQKNGYWKFMKRLKSKSFRFKRLRQKIEWDKKVSKEIINLPQGYQICEYQPDYPFGTVNICNCSCNGDC